MVGWRILIPINYIKAQVNSRLITICTAHFHCQCLVVTDDVKQIDWHATYENCNELSYVDIFLTELWAASWQTPTKWHVRPAKTQISLGIRPVWSVFPVRLKKAWVLSYPLSVQRRLWSDLADAKADLTLRRAHSHFVGFVMRRLNIIGALYGSLKYMAFSMPASIWEKNINLWIA